MDIQIGRVTHFYDKRNVAVIEVQTQALKVGDRVRISGPQSDSVFEIRWLQVEYRQVSYVEVGDTCGIKVPDPVIPGDMVYLLTQK